MNQVYPTKRADRVSRVTEGTRRRWLDQLTPMLQRGPRDFRDIADAFGYLRKKGDSTQLRVVLLSLSLHGKINVEREGRSWGRISLPVHYSREKAAIIKISESGRITGRVIS